MKEIKRFIKNLVPGAPKKAFYVAVKCSDCGEEVKVRINRSSDFQIEYNAQNPEHYYTIKKEIIGKNCFNLMGLKLALTKNLKVLFDDVSGCKFIEFERE
ncbi:MAG: hypothetical protein KJ706_09835 [Candidatus Omnitrophica bacterium]|nr:hypothetical protein [Candidatus Omnitrophota bacterium]MBU4590465.1 hypothetical protein [Candidatus Omnitrophota bacterium]